MIFRYFLDGNLISEPEGWDKFITDIKRENSTNSITISKEFSLTFGQAEYFYFENKIDTQGYIDYSTIVIEYSIDEGNAWKEFHNGIIYLTDISFDEKRKECTVKIQDNSFYAFINNNIDVGAFLYSNTSKNGVSIDPIPQKYLEAFVSSTGTYFPSNTTNGYEYKCYLVHDVFKFLVAFMSDDKVKFKSDTFDYLGKYHDYIITTGYVMRYSILDGFNGAINPQGINKKQFEDSWKEISFKKFYEEMHRRFNLMMWIETINGQPTIRIESEEYSRQSSTLNLTNHFIDELTKEFDTDLLYSKVEFKSGATEAISPFTLFDDKLKLIGFREEELVVLGQCNLNNSLSLTNDFIHDHNVIQDCLEQGWGTSFTNEYDDKIFIINAKDDGGNYYYAAVQTNWIQNPPPFFYNEKLNNYNIIQRFFQGVPSNLSQYIGGDPSTKMKAVYNYSTDVYPIVFAPTILQPVQFSDDYNIGFDNGALPYGNYGGLTPQGSSVSQANSRYTAPFSANYFFSFEFDLIYAVGFNSGMDVWIKIYDSSAVFQYEILQRIQTPIAGIYNNYIMQFPPMYMDSGWYAEAAFTTPSINSDYPVIDANNGMKWLCNNFVIGYITNTDLNEVPIYQYKFKVPMNIDELFLIENNLPSLFPFRTFKNQSTRNGWIKSLRYNHKDQIAEVILISSKNIN